MIKISIITINFNNAAGLKKTLESIKNLKCPDGVELESIVVDGASRDNSVDIIKSYTDDTVTFYVSEPDKGIYDAMNKGIRMASGDWLNFMNSGDCFVSDDVLSKLNEEINWSDENMTLFWGGNTKNGLVSPSHSISIAKKGIIPGCHQSMFFRNIGLLYNTKYKIYSDFDYFLDYYLRKPASIKKIATIISDSEPDGIGACVSLTKRKDKLRIMVSRFGVIHTLNVCMKEFLKRALL